MAEPITYRILIYAISIFVFVASVAFSKWRDLSRERKLRDLVSWSVVNAKPQELLVHSHDLPLWAYLKNAQIKYIPQEHHISGDDEWQFAKEILEAYQNYLTQSYFRGHLKEIKSKYAVDGEDYFMSALHDFLSSHECDSKFLGYDMHEKTVDYKGYGSWGGPLFDATYSLSKFAVVYHKMYYIAYHYCKNSKITNPKGSSFQNEKYIREILDTNQIQISRY